MGELEAFAPTTADVWQRESGGGGGYVKQGYWNQGLRWGRGCSGPRLQLQTHDDKQGGGASAPTIADVWQCEWGEGVCVAGGHIEGWRGGATMIMV
jgi:hypothetical protein